MLLKKISLGLAQADKSYGFGSQQKDKFFDLINFALENGINKIDTSPNYKSSDKIISKINTKSLKISSKILISEVKISKISSSLDKAIENIFESNQINKLENLLFYDPLIPMEKKRWKIYFKKN